MCAAVNSGPAGTGVTSAAGRRRFRSSQVLAEAAGACFLLTCVVVAAEGEKVGPAAGFIARGGRRLPRCLARSTQEPIVGSRLELPRLDLEDDALILGRIYGTDTALASIDARESLRLTLEARTPSPSGVQARSRGGPSSCSRCVVHQWISGGSKVHALAPIPGKAYPLERCTSTAIPGVCQKNLTAPWPRFRGSWPRPDSPILVLSTGAGLSPVFESPDRTWLAGTEKHVHGASG